MKFTCPAGNKSRQRTQGLLDLMYQDQKKLSCRMRSRDEELVNPCIRYSLHSQMWNPSPCKIYIEKI